MYLLKQDFTHQNFTHTAFAKSLGFNMVVHDDHYPEFKEVLYSFIDRHYKHVIDWDVDPATFSANDE